MDYQIDLKHSDPVNTADFAPRSSIVNLDCFGIGSHLDCTAGRIVLAYCHFDSNNCCCHSSTVHNNHHYRTPVHTDRLHTLLPHRKLRGLRCRCCPLAPDYIKISTHLLYQKQASNSYP